MTREQLGRILDTLRDRLVRFYQHRGCSSYDAEDLAGEIVVQILSSPGSQKFVEAQWDWISDNGIPRPFFAQAYRLLSALRKRSSKHSPVDPHSLDPPVGDNELEQLDLLAECLSGRQKTAFDLLRHGHTQAETAQILSVSERTIRNWLSRWRRMGSSFMWN